MSVCVWNHMNMPSDSRHKTLNISSRLVKPIAYQKVNADSSMHKSFNARIHMRVAGSNFIILVYLGQKTEYEIFSCYDSLYIFIIFLIIIIGLTHQSEADLCTTLQFPNLLLVRTSRACVSSQNH